MLKEAADELFGGDLRSFDLISRRFLVPESHLAVFEAEYAIIADRYAEDVWGKKLFACFPSECAQRSASAGAEPHGGEGTQAPSPRGSVVQKTGHIQNAIRPYKRLFRNLLALDRIIPDRGPRALPESNLYLQFN